jgi:AcrR family transcriptional regulator
MPRPRTASDVEILEAASRTISRVGPGRLTLADVAGEVGLSPATLIQRFRSKRGLLLALARHAVGTIDECFASVRRGAGSPVGALLAAATEMAQQVESPEALANHLAFLQIDLSDPTFHAVALAGAQRTLAGYDALLREAIAAGEIAPCDTGALSRAIQAIAGGSLINWAIHRDGAVLDWLRADLDVLLGPYRRPRPGSADVVPRAAPRTRHNAGIAPGESLGRGAPSTEMRPRPRRRDDAGRG